jgi:ketosteroid isomerase-like protein
MSTTSSADQIEPQQLEAWAAGYLEAWNSHDPGGVARHCTEDVVWDDPGLPEPLEGRDGVRAFVEMTIEVFPDFQVEELVPPVMTANGALVLGPYRMTGTMLGPWRPAGFASTGARIAVQGVDEWTFRDNLMCHYTTRYDSLDMARQLGIMPPTGSGAERAMARLQHVQARFQRRRTAHR